MATTGPGSSNVKKGRGSLSSSNEEEDTLSKERAALCEKEAIKAAQSAVHSYTELTSTISIDSPEQMLYAEEFAGKFIQIFYTSFMGAMGSYTRKYNVRVSARNYDSLNDQMMEKFQEDVLTRKGARWARFKAAVSSKLKLNNSKLDDKGNLILKEAVVNYLILTSATWQKCRLVLIMTPERREIHVFMPPKAPTPTFEFAVKGISELCRPPGEQDNLLIKTRDGLHVFGTKEYQVWIDLINEAMKEDTKPENADEWSIPKFPVGLQEAEEEKESLRDRIEALNSALQSRAAAFDAEMDKLRQENERLQQIVREMLTQQFTLGLHLSEEKNNHSNNQNQNHCKNTKNGNQKSRKSADALDGGDESPAHTKHFNDANPPPVPRRVRSRTSSNEKQQDNTDNSSHLSSPQLSPSPPHQPMYQNSLQVNEPQRCLAIIGGVDGAQKEYRFSDMSQMSQNPDDGLASRHMSNFSFNNQAPNVPNAPSQRPSRSERSSLEVEDIKSGGGRKSPNRLLSPLSSQVHLNFRRQGSSNHNTPSSHSVITHTPPQSSPPSDLSLQQHPTQGGKITRGQSLLSPEKLSFGPANNTSNRFAKAQSEGASPLNPSSPPLRSMGPEPKGRRTSMENTNFSLMNVALPNSPFLRSQTSRCSSKEHLQPGSSATKDIVQPLGADMRNLNPSSRQNSSSNLAIQEKYGASSSEMRKDGRHSKTEPVPQTQQVPQSISGPQFNDDFNRQDWFHGSIDRDDAVTLVMTGPSGTYLIRTSGSKDGQYAITLNWAGTPRHLRIVVTQNECRVSNMTFPSTSAMIGYFQRHPLPSGASNGEPVVYFTEYVPNSLTANAVRARKGGEDEGHFRIRSQLMSADRSDSSQNSSSSSSQPFHSSSSTNNTTTNNNNNAIFQLQMSSSSSNNNNNIWSAGGQSPRDIEMLPSSTRKSNPYSFV